ncbi:MAG: flagellar biosynthesis protein FlhA [Firmicutes bacterium]|nr:flagellar biosynthesis protein FlhA [Bacillota bacterium]
MATSIRRQNILERLVSGNDLIVVLGVVLIVVMMILPLPPLMLDLLLAVNISLALLVLLLTMSITEPLQLSVFPSLLLIATLFRLALNVSSTRLILLHGFAGRIIEAFGNFVVGGNYVVGFVIFLILVVIQFVVITKGAERVAEVAARFTLDAMPGKQMSIDADLNAGLITDREARQRRREIEREADFYGSMDGASKFVKGDAIAGIIITVINILGGFAIGVGQQGMSLAEALQRYTLLTVGDGLVSQIPALLISTATGIIITRAASDKSMGVELTEQLFAEPKVLRVAAGVVFFFAFIPGLPVFPFCLLGGTIGGLAYVLQKWQVSQAQAKALEAEERELEETKRPENVLSYLQLDRIELEIGYGLIPLVDAEQGGDLLERVTMIRRQIALEMGLVIPPVRIRDNLQLAPGAYSIKIKGVEVGQGELMLNHYLCMDSGGVLEPVPGIETREPAFGLPALWVPASRRQEAEVAGYTVVDPPSVLATHLTEIIRRYSHELVGRQEVKLLLDGLKEEYGAVVDELVPNLLTLGEIQKVLQNLLQEGISIRNLVTVLESLADCAPLTKDTDILTEYVREALARQISQAHTGDQGFIPAITLDPALEDLVSQAIQHTERGTFVNLDPKDAGRLLDGIAKSWEKASAVGHQAVILCSPPIRLALRRLTERALPSLPILSYNEIAADSSVQAVGMVTWNDES